MGKQILEFVKFLSFSSENENLSHELRVEEFLNHFKLNEVLAEWQVKQAYDDIKIYVHQFVEKGKFKVPSGRDLRELILSPSMML